MDESHHPSIVPQMAPGSTSRFLVRGRSRAGEAAIVSMEIDGGSHFRIVILSKKDCSSRG
jgi:hypothetical protein